MCRFNIPLWKTDQINVKGWPCGCGITLRGADGNLYTNVPGNGLLPAPHGANYTYKMPPGGMWGGIIGTSNNGYITAFQWLSSQVKVLTSTNGSSR